MLPARSEFSTEDCNKGEFCQDEVIEQAVISYTVLTPNK